MSTTPLFRLKQAIVEAAGLDALRDALGPIAAELGVVYDEADVYRSGGEQSRYATITFAEPVAASDLCDAMGWERPYAVSGDVHQRSWSVRVWEADLVDPYGPRIATRAPEIGAWTASPTLVARPPGPLPGVSAGASPAYDLRLFSGAVRRLDLWPPGSRP